MFRCEVTGELSDPFEKPEFVVIERRRKEYFGVKTKKRFKKKSSSSQRKKSQKVTKKLGGTIEKIGEGWEISKVIKVRRSTLAMLDREGKKISCNWVD